MKPEVGPVCHEQMHYGRGRSPGLCHSHVHQSLTYRQNLLSSLKTTECHFTLQATVSWHQSSCAWRCRGVSGSLARGTHDPKSSCKQAVPNDPWWHRRCNMCWDFFPGCCLGGHCCLHLHRSWCVSLLGDCPETSLQVCECSTDHCKKQRHTTDTFCQHVQQFIDMSIQLPIGLKCDHLQMAEVVQQEYVLIGGAWLYPRVNVATTVHLSKHHRYCLQSQNRGHNDKPPACHLIAKDHNKWITNTTSP